MKRYVNNKCLKNEAKSNSWSKRSVGTTLPKHTKNSLHTNAISNRNQPYNSIDSLIIFAASKLQKLPSFPCLPRFTPPPIERDARLIVKRSLEWCGCWSFACHFRPVKTGLSFRGIHIFHEISIVELEKGDGEIFVTSRIFTPCNHKCTELQGIFGVTF